MVSTAVVMGFAHFVAEKGSSKKSSISPTASNTWVNVSWPGASSVSFAKRCSPGALRFFQRTTKPKCGLLGSSSNVPETVDCSASGRIKRPVSISTAAAGADRIRRNGTAADAARSTMGGLGVRSAVSRAAVTRSRPTAVTARAMTRRMNRMMGEPRTPRPLPGSRHNARDLQMPPDCLKKS